jgi:glycerol-3-phosphate dehydrogenase
MRVAIIGGGVGSLWLAHEAAQAGFSCTVLSEQPVAAYASIRNQGWLQSGALYAGNGEARTGIDCLVSSQEIRSFAPEAIRNDIPSFFLFDDPIERDSYGERCEELGIPVTAMAIGCGPSPVEKRRWRNLPS